jgi:hypothetical protein
VILPAAAAAEAATATAKATTEAAEMRGGEVLRALKIIGPHCAPLLYLRLTVEL